VDSNFKSGNFLTKVEEKHRVKTGLKKQGGAEKRVSGGNKSASTAQNPKA